MDCYCCVVVVVVQSVIASVLCLEECVCDCVLLCFSHCQLPVDFIFAVPAAALFVCWCVNTLHFLGGLNIALESLCSLRSLQYMMYVCMCVPVHSVDVHGYKVTHTRVYMYVNTCIILLLYYNVYVCRIV